MKKLDFTHKFKHRKRLTCGDVLKFIRKMKKDNFIVKNLFKKGLVCAFLFVVLLSIHMSIACGWGEVAENKDRLEKLKSLEYEKIYNAMEEGTSTEKTFLLKDDLTDDKCNIKGSPYTEYNYVIGYINMGKTSAGSTLKWSIVGN